MRQFIPIYVITVMLGGLLLLAQPKPPDKLVFNTKQGNVTFDHAAHLARAKNDCATCHEKLFTQSKTAPLNFKGAIHKTAETAKTSCGACHNPSGPAFETRGNCTKCHVK